MRPQSPYLTISQLAARLNAVLEGEFPHVMFRGEISQLTPAASGHLYFTIKDAESQLSAVMWRSGVSMLRFKPQPGVAVQCRGRPNIYNKSGRFQMIVDQMEPAGEGELQRKFLELKAKLEREGYFNPERKRAIPFLPQTIGIVTSKTGAAIHDMMVKLRERMPCMRVILADVRVQGEGSALEIADGIDALNESGLVDVIIVGRGGGSLEDLWAFNEEAVVKAIFRSRVPVISGVGHEVDVTLSDLVADARAPTPTAAAEMVVPKREDLLRMLSEYERRLSDLSRWFHPHLQRFDDLVFALERAMNVRLDSSRLELEAATHRLRAIQPEALVSLARSKLDLFEGHLARVITRQLTHLSTQLDEHRSALQHAFPRERIHGLLDRVANNERRLESATSQRLKTGDALLLSLAQRLESVNPNAVLARGFSVVRQNGAIVTDASKVAAGSPIHVTLSKGALTAVVDQNKK